MNASRMGGTADDRLELLLVHGAWHGSWAFEPFLERLLAAAVRARAVNLPSANNETSKKDADLAADAAVVRQALNERRVPTVVVGHSYGGVVISEATEGVEHVCGLIYLCAILLDKDESVMSAMKDGFPSWIVADEEAGTMSTTAVTQVFYSNTPPALAEAAVARLLPQSIASFASPQTAAAWRTKPNVYVICQRDQALPAPVQEAMSSRAQRVVRIDCDHSPFLSAPDELADLLMKEANLMFSSPVSL